MAGSLPAESVGVAGRRRAGSGGMAGGLRAEPGWADGSGRRSATAGPVHAGSAQDGGLALLLLFADGRLPAGGHAHSGGVEAAVAAGLVADLADLRAYLVGRLATAGRVDAAVAVMCWGRLRPGATAAVDAGVTGGSGLAGRTDMADAGGSGSPGVVDIGRVSVADAGGSGSPGVVDALLAIEAEASARLGSPAQRAAGRAQGRGLLRVARRCWSAPALDLVASVHPDGPLAPMVMGAVGALGAMTALEVATAALCSALSGPAWAAVRLLGLDPLEVTATLVRLTADVDREAHDAAARWGHSEAAPADLPAGGAPLAEIGAQAHAAWEVRLFAS